MIDFAAAYPNSRKVYEERTATLTAGADITVRVPMREVALSGGEAPVRLYDTSGPQAGTHIVPLRTAGVVETHRRLAAAERNLAHRHA